MPYENLSAKTSWEAFSKLFMKKKMKPLQKIITENMALPIPQCLDSEVSIPYSERNACQKIEYTVRICAAQLKAEVIELNVQVDHVHLLS